MRRVRQQNGFNERSLVVIIMALLVICRSYFGGKAAKTAFDNQVRQQEKQIESQYKTIQDHCKQSSISMVNGQILFRQQDRAKCLQQIRKLEDYMETQSEQKDLLFQNISEGLDKFMNMIPMGLMMI